MHPLDQSWLAMIIVSGDKSETPNPGPDKALEKQRLAHTAASAYDTALTASPSSRIPLVGVMTNECPDGKLSAVTCICYVLRATDVEFFDESPSV